ncbi:uncharacterized protein LOC142590670 isoform X2 [Dermacentor variabilis]|uniref:uncharacterized protein LOC142590670 isoform X2 n=1 Tax=Dermacentor variabilis TaxID=34621 RepID=UPI003F5B7068
MTWRHCTHAPVPAPRKMATACFTPADRLSLQQFCFRGCPVIPQRMMNNGLTNAMSLAGSITTETACHAPSKVIGQVEVGMQCSFPLADKSVGCSLKAWSVSRSMQTTESVDQLSSTSGSNFGKVFVPS